MHPEARLQYQVSAYRTSSARDGTYVLRACDRDYVALCHRSPPKEVELVEVEDVCRLSTVQPPNRCIWIDIVDGEMTVLSILGPFAKGMGVSLEAEISWPDLSRIGPAPFA